ncbi:zinc-dependent alcohol dehydrogenase family protein [Pseudomonas luteola]|uniref:zinc-dependent alcohol dehydrogenase family protein n=1 Tax=Pseudomonas luteola TaxID=47886 RepID=UPI0012392F44|nr:MULTISPECIES: zinc-dependent alcohol dehydrogenase family protein [Pseudomonas]MBA1247466.1 zinc-dependent alcohol dehydrogenase family protein [Pseudomonas zeshuii]MCG7371722.1 zinc-dependent alcohol dehydrogenase family protein [Pseudomonas luteola]QEU29009.1 zinc-dependent alcohol dehydrogenase family protein [Pseudomonas luteola]
MSRVIRFHQFGSADVLCCENQPTPEPGAGEVLVRVQALGVCWGDVLWRQNLADEPATLPAGFGSELAGEVVSVGEGVRHFQPGMRVASFPAHSINQYPASGDMVLMPQQALTEYPDTLTPAEAAVHYAGLLLAYFALVDLAQLKAGQQVLVTEASNCVGPAVVQLAAALGAQVIAATSESENRALLKGLGAVKVVSTDEQDLVLEVERFTESRGVEVVLDALCGPQLSRLGDIAATRGKLIIYGMGGGNEASFPACAAFKKHLQIFRHSVLDFTGHPELGLEPHAEAVQRALTVINQMTRDGLLKPIVAHTLPFDQFVEAHRLVENECLKGRVVLTVE